MDHDVAADRQAQTRPAWFIGQRVAKLLVETDQETRYAAYRDLHRWAVEKGYSIPLFQGVKTVAYQQALQFTKYDNGWILPQTWSFKAA